MCVFVNGSNVEIIGCYLKEWSLFNCFAPYLGSWEEGANPILTQGGGGRTPNFLLQEPAKFEDACENLLEEPNIFFGENVKNCHILQRGKWRCIVDQIKLIFLYDGGQFGCYL